MTQIPRAGHMTFNELLRQYETLYDKTGESSHDEAVETFQMEDRDLKGTYWLDDDSVEVE